MRAIQACLQRDMAGLVNAVASFGASSVWASWSVAFWRVSQLSRKRVRSRETTQRSSYLHEGRASIHTLGMDVDDCCLQRASIHSEQRCSSGRFYESQIVVPGANSDIRIKSIPSACFIAWQDYRLLCRACLHVKAARALIGGMRQQGDARQFGAYDPKGVWSVPRCGGVLEW